MRRMVEGSGTEIEEISVISKQVINHTIKIEEITYSPKYSSTTSS